MTGQAHVESFLSCLSRVSLQLVPMCRGAQRWRGLGSALVRVLEDTPNPEDEPRWSCPSWKTPISQYPTSHPWGVLPSFCFRENRRWV